ncbi:MAG TPA: hypothetical protein VH306_13160 [Gaiellaceae bacterium]
MSRFSQAISEGDGISLIPVLAGDVEGLARDAEGGGAEALAVAAAADVERVRASVGLPVLLCARVRAASDLEAAETVGADAVVLDFGELEDDDGLLEQLHAEALALGFDCAIDVCDDEQLMHALERVDPDILTISNGQAAQEDAFERTLDLLPDVPAGKLVIAESGPIVREQVLALERAGVDAILATQLAGAGDFAGALADLVGEE